MFNTIPVVLPQFSVISIHQVRYFRMTHDDLGSADEAEVMMIWEILSRFCLRKGLLLLALFISSVSGSVYTTQFLTKNIKLFVLAFHFQDNSNLGHENAKF